MSTIMQLIVAFVVGVITAIAVCFFGRKKFNQMSDVADIRLSKATEASRARVHQILADLADKTSQQANPINGGKL
jgi:hypothetical protein